MYTFKRYLQILNEGGGGGHMNHPFDLPSINTGKQLLRLFEKTVKHIKRKSAATKLDGVNVSVRLIEGPNGLEWAMDRGSMKPLDLSGITINKLQERFPPSIDQDSDTGDVVETEHGMVKAGSIVLSILNSALPDMEKEIKKLGLTKSFDGHNAFFINTEFIEHGGTNVVQYGKNFIAFHGINKFKHVTKNPSTGNTVNRREASEVSYNEDVFNRFIDIVQVHSKKQDFDTHGVINVQFSKEPEFQTVLDSKIEILLTPSHSETRILQEWLFAARNPYDKKIKMFDTNVKAMEKKVYQYVIGENNVSVEPLSEAFNEHDIKTAIDASIFWHATRMLGREVNSSLETLHNDTIPVGEGIVIRDLPSGRTKIVGGKRVPIPHPMFKITGEFIVSGLQSSFK
tara:strand:- start:250 stop:1446 length:1197 start_codon:yes stop_codon:yes gene_type:complete